MTSLLSLCVNQITRLEPCWLTRQQPRDGRSRARAHPPHPPRVRGRTVGLGHVRASARADVRNPSPNAVIAAGRVSEPTGDLVSALRWVAARSAARASAEVLLARARALTGCPKRSPRGMHDRFGMHRYPFLRISENVRPIITNTSNFFGSYPAVLACIYLREHRQRTTQFVAPCPVRFWADQLGASGPRQTPAVARQVGPRGVAARRLANPPLPHPLRPRPPPDAPPAHFPSPACRLRTHPRRSRSASLAPTSHLQGPRP
jgi:hypothetical protein